MTGEGRCEMGVIKVVCINMSDLYRSHGGRGGGMDAGDKNGLVAEDGE